MRQWDLDLVVGFASDETMVAAQFIFGGVLDRHPQLHLHIPHAGGNTPWLKGRFEMALRKRPWAKGLLNRSLDEIWRQMTFDCLIKPGPAMEFLVKARAPIAFCSAPTLRAGTRTTRSWRRWKRCRFRPRIGT